LLYAENLRFLPGEEANAASLAEGWRALADLYVSDAFSVCHRRHASVAALPERLPAFAGASFVHEHRHLRDVLAAPRPRALVLGGAKVQQKMAELPALARSFDLIALGGLCAVHAAAALGTLPPLQDARALPPAGALAGLPAELLVPHDWRVVREGRCETLESDRVPDPAAIADVGPGSMEGLLARLASCRAIFWNGPLGRYETDEGFGATAALAAACVGFGRAGAQVAVGGGDTVAAVQATASAGRIGFVSAAGGAALAYMARGDELPGIRPLVLRGASSPAAPASLAGES